MDAALASSGSCLDRLCGSARLGGAIDAHLLKIVIEEELGFRVELVRRRIVGRFLTSKEAIFCHRNEAPFYPWCLVAHTVHSSATFHRSQMALVPSSPSSTESMISTRCSMQYAMPYPATEAQHASALTCRALVLSRWVLSDGRLSPILHRLCQLDKSTCIPKYGSRRTRSDTQGGSPSVGRCVPLPLPLEPHAPHDA